MIGLQAKAIIKHSSFSAIVLIAGHVIQETPCCCIEFKNGFLHLLQKSMVSDYKFYVIIWKLHMKYVMPVLVCMCVCINVEVQENVYI